MTFNHSCCKIYNFRYDQILYHWNHLSTLHVLGRRTIILNKKNSILKKIRRPYPRCSDSLRSFLGTRCEFKEWKHWYLQLLHTWSVVSVNHNATTTVKRVSSQQCYDFYFETRHQKWQDYWPHIKYNSFRVYKSSLYIFCNNHVLIKLVFLQLEENWNVQYSTSEGDLVIGWKSTSPRWGKAQELTLQLTPIKFSYCYLVNSVVSSMVALPFVIGPVEEDPVVEDKAISKGSSVRNPH